MLYSSGTWLVTGGAGFVGSAVVAEALSRPGCQRVVVLDSLSTGSKEYLPTDPRVELQAADLRDGDTVLRVFADAHAERVIHLAAIHYIPYCNQHPTETLEVNVTGTQNVLEACRRHPPRSLAIASSAAVYPIHDEACSEESLVAAPTDIYGLSKHINEQQLALFAKDGGVRCAAARLFNVYGPHETNPHVLPEILRQALSGNLSLKLGNVKPKRDYVYVTDIASGLVAMAERNEHPFRTYNVGTGIEYSVEEMVAELAKISSLNLTIDTDPAKVRKSDRMHLLCDRRRIEKELGWQPQYDMKRGMSELWQWAQSHHEHVQLPFASK
ncbi:NAD-dependent epimerase/dehydratase family protein [Anatilimnocola sp. NA78]|uniref:NAD-dependent epimerase/dehydratase family protein n=1 Tax=Anatilimnocola sp. NA78 TaxID=3415683 RepID=UPI003CE47E63